MGKQILFQEINLNSLIIVKKIAFNFGFKMLDVEFLYIRTLWGPVRAETTPFGMEMKESIQAEITDFAK